MDRKYQKYILLNDRVGEHIEESWISLSTKSVPAQLLPGEICEALPEAEQPVDPEKIALTVISTTSQKTRLECPTLDVSKLTDSEADLLVAVTSTEERFYIYRERNRLGPGKLLNIGTKVFVKLTNPPKEVTGVIWYKGALPTYTGTMFGVELVGKDAEGLGTSDGTFGGRRYFNCQQDCGVFVAFDKLRPQQEPAKSPKKETTIKTNIIPTNIIPTFSSKGSRYACDKAIAKNHNLKINQRVVVYLEDHEARGTVRYISETLDANDDVTVGIELDKRMGKGTGVFRGKQRFACKQGFAVFVPSTTVIPEEDFYGAQQENNYTERLSQSDGLSASLGFDVNLQKSEHLEIKRRSSSATSISSKASEEALEIARRHQSNKEMVIEEQRRILQTFKDKQTTKLENETDGTRKSNMQHTDVNLQKPELETRLQSIQQRSDALERALAIEQQAHEASEKRLHNSEQRSIDLKNTLTMVQKVLEETEGRLHSFKQRSDELETYLATERQAHKETEGRLHSSEQRSDELENTLDAERQRRNELETTLATAQQALEEYQCSRDESCDWVLARNEISLCEKEIGVGGWGKVMEGIFRGCEVAVKQIHKLILSPHNRRLFEREMSIASRCRHPCLLQFIGATNDDQNPLFVTELLETSLREVLRDRALEPTEITTIALDVAKGLNYLHLNHPAPIIHRDISSANVLLWKHSTCWRAKVSDYGTANFVQHSMTVSPGAVIYSAPEAKTSTQSPKLDVFSFGVLLCEMNIRELPDVARRNKQVAMVTSQFFRRLIRRCLQQNPEERPSMAEIIDAFGNSQR